MTCIALLEEDELLLAGIKEIFSTPGVTVIPVKSLKHFNALFKTLRIDVLIMAMEGCDYSALDTIKIIHKACDDRHSFIPVVLTDMENKEALRWKIVFSGVSILSRKATPRELKSEVFKAMQRTVHNLLSPREWQVLNLLCSGLSQKQASYILNISPKTLSTQKQTLQKKLQCSNKAELNRVISRLIPPPVSS